MFKDPIELHHNEETRIRGSGRTTRMVESLPEYGGYIIIVLHEKMKKQIYSLIKELRSEEIAKRATFVTFGEWKRDGHHKFSLGVNALPVYVDHTVQDAVVCDFLRDVNYFYLVDKDAKLYVKNNEGAI